MKKTCSKIDFNNYEGVSNFGMKMNWLKFDESYQFKNGELDMIEVDLMIWWLKCVVFVCCPGAQFEHTERTFENLTFII